MSAGAGRYQISSGFSKRLKSFSTRYPGGTLIRISVFPSDFRSETETFCEPSPESAAVPSANSRP